MKRRLSLFFVLLANIAILAHAVVPHHHHNRVVTAFVNVMDADDEHPFWHIHHDHHQGNHSHHDEDEGCVVFESLQAAVVQLQKSDSGLDKAPHFGGGITLFFVESSAWVATPPLARCASADTSYYASYHTYYLARAKGLRAPPTC